MPKVTVKELESAKPKDRHYRIAVDRGLALRVATDGTKSWEVRIQIAGKQRQASLPKPFGNRGEGYFSLVEAIAENARIQALARQDIDFRVKEDQERKVAAAKAEQDRDALRTLMELFEAWTSKGVARSDGNAEITRTFEKYIAPVCGSIPVKDLKADHFREALQPLSERGIYRTIDILLGILNQMFSWAEHESPWRRLLVEGIPTANIKLDTLVGPDYDPENVRERLLTPTEIKELWQIFSSSISEYEQAPNKRSAEKPLKREYQLLVGICLSTLSRIGETSKTEWAHVNFATRIWTIPPENQKRARGKNGKRIRRRKHDVYLSDFALALFRELYLITGDHTHCFPAQRKVDTHVKANAIASQIGDRQVTFMNRKKLSRRTHNNSLVLQNGKTGEWTTHDMRRTGATVMESLGVSSEMIDRCQNHIVKNRTDVSKHYQQYEFTAEKQDAWEKLGAWLENLLQKRLSVQAEHELTDADWIALCAAG